MQVTVQLKRNQWIVFSIPHERPHPYRLTAADHRICIATNAKFPGLFSLALSLKMLNKNNYGKIINKTQQLMQ